MAKKRKRVRKKPNNKKQKAKVKIRWYHYLPYLPLVYLIVWAFRPEVPLPANASIDKIVVYKSKRTMEVYDHDSLLRKYPISLGFRPKGHKHKEGDGRTPEGTYTIDYKNPKSVAYRSLHISYPNAADRARAKKRGVSPGGQIMIHGQMNYRINPGRFHLWKDWTGGCIAVTNKEMDQLFNYVKKGATIIINP